MNLPAPLRGGRPCTTGCHQQCLALLTCCARTVTARGFLCLRQSPARVGRLALAPDHGGWLRQGFLPLTSGQPGLAACRLDAKQAPVGAQGGRLLHGQHCDGGISVGLELYKGEPQSLAGEIAMRGG